MKSIRIQPISGEMISVDIVCDCGRNGLKNQMTGEVGFHHSLLVGGGHTSLSPIFVCACGRRYEVTSQNDHFHITNK